MNTASSAEVETVPVSTASSPHVRKKTELLLLLAFTQRRPSESRPPFEALKRRGWVNVEVHHGMSEGLTRAPGVAEQGESTLSDGLPAASVHHAETEPVEAHRGRGRGQDEYGWVVEVQGLRVKIGSPTRGGGRPLGVGDRHQCIQPACVRRENATG